MPNPSQWTLIEAAEAGDERVVRLLLENEAEVEMEDRSRRTALHAAAGNGQEAVVQLLLEKEADVEAKDMYGRTPLHLAAEQGHKAVVRLLLGKGADIEAKDKDRETALEWAAGNGHEAVVLSLLESGADVSARDSDGLTALDWALGSGREAVVWLLLDHGASFGLKDTTAKSPIVRVWEKTMDEEPHLQNISPKNRQSSGSQRATSSGAVQMCADVEAEYPSEWSGARQEHEKSVQLPLNMGAHVKAKVAAGWTVLHAAKKPRHLGAVEAKPPWRRISSIFPMRSKGSTDPINMQISPSDVKNSSPGTQPAAAMPVDGILCRDVSSSPIGIPIASNIQTSPPDNDVQAVDWNSKSIRLGNRFLRTGSIQDLEDAIRSGREAVKAIPPQHPKRATYLNNLALWLMHRFDVTGALENIEEAIRFGREVVKLIPPSHSDFPKFLNNLSVYLSHRFDRMGAIEDLDEAICKVKEAIKIAPPNHSELSKWLTTLCAVLGDRFIRTGAVSDLDEAIQSGEEAVKIISPDHPGRAACLNNLGLMLSNRFKRTGELKDIEDAIRSEKEAINVTPPSHTALPTYLNNLGIMFVDRFKRIGEIKDLEEAIQRGKEAIEATPASHTSRGLYFNNLGLKQRYLFQSKGEIEDLGEAISSGRKAIEATPPNHPKLAMYLSNLSLGLGDSFVRTGAIEDLEEAISKTMEAVKITPADHPGLALRLNNLSLWQGNRFNRFGSLEDLEKAIHNGKKAVRLTQPNQPDRATRLINISVWLGARFSLIGGTEDLKEAICNAREAVMLTPPNHPDRPRWLNNLGVLLIDQFKRTGVVTDLEEAISRAMEAVKTSPFDHPRQSTRLNNLSTALGLRFVKTGNMVDLEEAIVSGRAAVKALPLDSPDRMKISDNLAVRLHERFERAGGLDDVGEAIYLGREAVKATALNHPDRGLRLNNLGVRLYDRFKRTGEREDVQEAKAMFTAALQLQVSPLLVRIRAGKYAGLLYIESSEWLQASEVLQVVVKLLPRISPQSLERDDQQHALSGLSGLSSLAASAILQAGRTASESLEILEAGRGIISGLAINVRNDVSQLGEQYPDLCFKYTELREKISLPLSVIARESGDGEFVANHDANQSPTSTSLSEAIDRRWNDVRELGRVEDEIRKLPRFGRFQSSLSRSDMMSLASNGPMVSFNVTKVRSDAFLITQNDIWSIALPELSYAGLKANIRLLVGEDKLSVGLPSTKASRNQRLREILWWLWKAAVLPVLDELKLISFPKPRRLPRVYWVASGLMGLSPIHAAGRCWGSSLENTVSHVVSTYVPTLKALAYSREWAFQPLTQPEQKVLIISMPKTVGKRDLLAEEEESIIKESISMLPVAALKVVTLPSKDVVLNEVRDASVAHFICHGNSDSKNPSNSGLFLGDSVPGKPDHLTIYDLATIAHHKGQIAYLSACSTAESSAEHLMDEVIHVANGFQLIGFPHVIGTMWEADNRAAVDIAGVFYREILRNMERFTESDRHDAVAYALHDAVRAVRDGKCSNNRRRKRTSCDDVIAWAPFIHIGA
jgi:ankyrin repeat protein/tetratricopeptide (TPR) repeat protein